MTPRERADAEKMYVQECLREHKASGSGDDPATVYPRFQELVAKHKLSTVASAPLGHSLGKKLLTLTIEKQGTAKARTLLLLDSVLTT